MNALEVVARPVFDKADTTWLTDMRSRRTHNHGPPYFTLVFQGAAFEPKDFAAAVRARAAGAQRIRFRLRSALVVPESTVKRFHVFLIPDEGFGDILRLHDRLHAGPLEACLRPDIPYLPHITVATTADYALARKIAAGVNAESFDIAGSIEALQVESRDGEKVRLISEIPLDKAGWFG